MSAIQTGHCGLSHSQEPSSCCCTNDGSNWLLVPCLCLRAGCIYVDGHNYCYLSLFRDARFGTSISVLQHDSGIVKQQLVSSRCSNNNCWPHTMF